MLLEVGGIGIGGLEARQTFSSPVPFRAYCYLVDFLEAKPPSPYRDGNPKGALVVLEAISGYPGGPLRKLNVIEDDHDVGEVGLQKESRKRGKEGLVGGYDHVALFLNFLFHEGLDLGKFIDGVDIEEGLVWGTNLLISSSLTNLTGTWS